MRAAPHTAWTLAAEVEAITCRRIAEAVNEARTAPPYRRRARAADYHDPHAATELALLVEAMT